MEREKLEAALRDFGANTSGGFLESEGREYLIRQIGRTSRLRDPQNVVVAVKNGQAILLRQLADVKMAPKPPSAATAATTASRRSSCRCKSSPAPTA